MFNVVVFLSHIILSQKINKSNIVTEETFHIMQHYTVHSR